MARKNRERARYLRNRSTARGFIRNNATLEDLAELESLIADKRKHLSDQENTNVPNDDN